MTRYSSRLACASREEFFLLHLASNSPWLWLVPVALSFVASLLVTPLVRWIATAIGDVDQPVGMKIHRRPTPLMGGVAVYLAFAFSVLTVLPATGPVLGLLLGGLVAVAVGLLDELFTLRPIVHFVGQVLAAIVVIVSGVGVVQSVSFPLGSLTHPGIHLIPIIGLVFTLFWLVGMINTVNFLDGMDGLASGVCALAALLLAAWASEPNRFFVQAMAHREDLIMPLALAGALIGFLPYNWRVASIFLGDSGAMFLGIALGAMMYVGPTKFGTALLVLLIPVLDVAWAIVRRRLSGRSFASQDKQHVYHRMVDLGLSHTATVLIMYSLCVMLGLFDLYLYHLGKLIAFIVLATLTGIAFVAMEIRAGHKTRERERKAQESDLDGVASNA